MAPDRPGDTTEGLYSAGRSVIRRSVIVLVTRALLVAAAAVVVGSLIDRAASGQRIGVTISWLAALLFGAAAFGWLSPMLANRTRTEVETDLRARLLGLVIRHPATRLRTGEVTSRATDGVAAVGSLAGKFLPQLIAGIVVPLLICGVVATIDVTSALVLLVTIPAVPILLRGMERRFTSVTTRYRETADRLSAEFFDGVQGMRTLRDLAAADRYGEALASESERLRGETMALLKVNQLALLVVDSLFTLGTVVAAAVAAVWRLGDGVITPGQAVSIVLLGVALIEPISQIGRFFYVGALGRAAARDIKGFIGDVSHRAGYIRRDGEGGWVEMKDVSFSYGEGRQVLDSLSLRVEPGEVVGLVGPSGAGKSTIIGLIAGLLEPDAGEVSTGGRVAMVSQRPFLFHGTLRENLLLADPSAPDDDLWAALVMADLDDLARGRGPGLDLDVGERGRQLSGGEAQRLTIARLLIADAPIVVLDEPTSNVDIETETRIRHALRRLTAGRTVIIVAHRHSTLADVDRVVTVAGDPVSEPAFPS